MKKNTFFLLLIFVYQATFGNSLKGQNHLIEGIEKYRLYIKLNPELRPDLEIGKVKFFSKTRNIKADLKQDLLPFVFRQVVNLTESDRSDVRSGNPYRELEGKFDKRLYSGLLEVVGIENMSKEEMLAIAEKLESYDDIEYCELSPLSPPPPPAFSEELPFMRATPDFSGDQFYLYGSQSGNVSGIYADHAWSKGISGQGVSFADVEWGWDYQHEDFSGQNVIDALPTTNNQYNDHGTGVLGEMYSADNGIGVKGCVYGADAFYGFSEITEGRATAISYAIDSLEAGDIIVYEMQTGGQNGEFVPADYSQSVWDVTKAATDAGMIVVAAAGNGNQNLDASFYSSYLARGDNGSIIVGAGTKVGRNKCSFSTYGSRVDVCGIGDWSIVTTGYGDLYGSGHTSYTKSFSGTSSSTPIVASAAIAVQSYAKNTYSEIISPRDMRAILKATGTPQGSGGHIGPLPNLEKAFMAVDSIFEGGTTKYKLTVENGSGGGNFEESATVSISANDAIMGQMFEKWTGDVSYLASETDPTTTVSMPAKDITVTATYKISDTVTVSDNYVLIAGWEGEADGFGTSSISVDTSKVQSDTILKTDFVLGTSNEATKEWVWAKVTGYSNGDFKDVYAIELTYTSNKSISLQLEQDILSEAGSNYEYTLPSGTNSKITIPIGDFKQPEWVKDDPSAVADLDLTKVSAISFSGLEENSTTNFTVNGVFIYGYKEGVVITKSLASLNSKIQIGIPKLTTENLFLSNVSQGKYSISVYNVSGKTLFKTEIELENNSIIHFGDKRLSKGAYLVRINGPLGSLTSRKIIR